MKFACQQTKAEKQDVKPCDLSISNHDEYTAHTMQCNQVTWAHGATTCLTIIKSDFIHGLPNVVANSKLATMCQAGQSTKKWVSRTYVCVHQSPGLLSPSVFSAYYTLFSKSRRFLALINAFLRLRRKKAWDGENLKNCRSIFCNIRL